MFTTLHHYSYNLDLMLILLYKGDLKSTEHKIFISIYASCKEVTKIVIKNY